MATPTVPASPPKERPWILAAVLFTGMTAVWAVSGISAPPAPATQEEQDSRSVGRLGVTKGGCMSGDQFHTNTNTVVKNTDWSKIEGAATMDTSTRLMIGSLKVLAEMKRLGTPPCPDLRPTYERWALTAH